MRLELDEGNNTETSFYLLSFDEVTVSGLFVGQFESNEGPEHRIFSKLYALKADLLQEVGIKGSLLNIFAHVINLVVFFLKLD